ncbi:spore germination protein GerPC [Rossellomorea aquimaris]|uniref:spore germination protein GerPC n=1 Tax=Rossellomorea aquimaris TaxID=189382 RepID=UPI001CD734AB|nr:spore germination protein GerPC [Rossellomorea aquimaris]MCA1056413.1 spore germination protein GerPC [Rossellomorea aquimaris]
MSQYYLTPQQIYQYIETLNKKMMALEKQVNALSEELTTLKESPKINVEKIEYKFDQLKVESLDGTLNIGLNPGGLKEEIEDFAVDPNGKKKAVKDLTPYKEKISKDISSYIQNDLPSLISDQELQLQRSIDASYHQMIQQDLMNQMPQRIDFYVQNIPFIEGKQTGEEWTEKIISKIKQDIQSALFSFMSQMPENMEGMKNDESTSD